MRRIPLSILCLAAALLGVGGAKIGWGFLNPDLKLPETTSKTSRMVTAQVDLHTVTYDQLVPHFEGLIAWKPDADPGNAFGMSGWICHNVRDLHDELDVLAWRVLIRSYHEGVRKPLSEYHEGEKDFPKGLFQKEKLKSELLPYFEAERKAMLAEREK